MPTWKEDQTEWKFRVPNQAEETKIQVSGVMDATDSDRTKIVLKDDETNQGPSVTSDAVAVEGVKSLSASMNVQPGEVDWFVQNKDGQMYSVDLNSDLKTIEHPEYTALRMGNTELPEDLETAKKAFPDIQVEELKAELSELKPSQQQELSDCYTAARADKELEKAVTNTPANENTNSMSAHEYDLSQHSF